jgi:importin subunit alpha-1
VRRLSSPCSHVSEQACWALGNIAGDTAANRNEVLTEGVLQPLLALCAVGSPVSLLRLAARTLLNLCRSVEPEGQFEGCWAVVLQLFDV